MAQPIRTNRIPQTIPRKAVSRRLFRCGRWSRKLIVTVTFEKAHGAGVTPDASARALKALSLSVGKDAVEHGHHYAWLRDYRARPLSFQAGLFLWHLAPRPSRMARLRPRGLGFAVALYTWASRGETLASTLAAQTVLRVREGRPLTRPMYLFGLRPLHLCGTRLEGGHRRLSRTLRFAWVEQSSRSIVGDTATRRHGDTPHAARRTPTQSRGRCSATGHQQRLSHPPGVPTFRRSGVRARPAPTTAPRQRLSFHSAVSS